jgi:HEPN domain-containing protein
MQHSTKVFSSMALDPALVEETAAWLDKADEDLRAARILAESAEPLPEVAVFHCQQAVEKAFKAFLVWHEVPFRRTHSLEELGEQCLRTDATLGAIVDEVVPLSEYAWRYRYPGEVELLGKGDVEIALSAAAHAVSAVKGRLSPETSQGLPS